MITYLKHDEFYYLMPSYSKYYHNFVKFWYLNYNGDKRGVFIDLEICEYNDKLITNELIKYQEQSDFYRWLLNSYQEKQILKKRRKEKFEKIKSL